MTSLPRTLLRWIGTFLILALVFLFAANLFYPPALKPLSPVLCPSGTTVETNDRILDPARRASDRHRIWCSSDRSSAEPAWEDITDRWIITMVACGAGAVLAFGVRSRLQVRPARYGAPVEPASRS